jgi:predicted dienelactone hydrolase
MWYPAGSGGTPVFIGDNAVFKGTPALQSAPIAEGSFPVILISHGGLRAAPNLGGWIAARLASEGFIVAVPQPPNSGQDASDAIHEIWLRPADLSATLTALARDPALAGKIDGEKVGVLGFLLGGSSALAVVGARRDAQAYSRSCDPGEVGLDCGWFAKNQIDLHKIDPAQTERSNLDRRINAVVAIDPELTATFTTKSLSAISVPVTIVNLGRSDEMLPALYAESLTGRIPGARYTMISDATHFDSFSECKPAGAAILRDEGDGEDLCGEGTRPRAEIHEQLATMIAAEFKRSLHIGP